VKPGISLNVTRWCKGLNPHLFGLPLRNLTVLSAHAFRCLILHAEIRWMQIRSKVSSDGFQDNSGKTPGLSVIGFCFAFLACFARDRFVKIRHILPLLMLLILPLAPALADNQPNMRDFARVMPLTLSGSGALYELTLPQEVYFWSMQHDLADVAVFNGHGEIVPFALLATESVRTPQPGRELPLFPLSSLDRQQQGNIALRVRTDEHGAIINLNTAQGAATGGRVAGYIVDAGTLDQPVTGFDLFLTPGSKGYVGTLQVESSDDLQQWHSHASGVVATLSAGEQQVGRDRIEFPAIRARYFRLTISPEQGVPHVESVTARLEPLPATQGREKKEVIITPVRGRNGEYLARTSGHLPIDRLRLVFPDENSLVRVSFLSRPDDKSPWIERGSGTFYRLRRDSGVVESVPLEIAPTSDDRWLIRIRQPGGGLGSSLPRLEVSWQPHRLVFAARGESPFFLAYGSARTGLDSLRDDGLEQGLATWELQRIKPLPALAGASQESGGRQALQPGIPAATWRKLVLWGALLMGVLLLARMAWQLGRELGLDGTQKKQS